MINNEFILNNNSKELSQKSSRTGNYKTANTNNDKLISENSFKKVLNEKSENLNEIENLRKNNLDNKDSKYINETNRAKVEKDDINKSELGDESTLEEAIKEIVTIIGDEENFQGNNIDSEAIEELVALLNQIINLPEFKNLLPTKLEDPMFISNIVNNINLETENVNSNKDIFNLANNILETLESKNSNKVLSEEQLNGFKAALETLSKNLLNKDTSLINNSIIIPKEVNGKNLAIKNLKDSKDIKINDTNLNIEDDLNEVEIKTILTDSKSNLDTNKNNESKVYMSKYGVIPEAEKDDKVLAKILGESESSVLNKQNTFINKLNINSNDVIKEPMTINKETMNADIIKNVKFMIKNAVSELKVKIYPKELGEMTIKLLSEEGILKADIRAKSKETYNLLNSNLNDIKKTLEQQNIKIQEVNITLYSDDTTYYSGENTRDEMFKNNENRQNKNSSNKSEYLIDEIESNEKLIEENSINQLV